MTTWSDSMSRILIDLTFLSNINQGLKPCFNKRLYVAADSWYGSFLRTIYNESGLNTYQRCASIFHEAIEQYETSKLEHKSIIYKHICAANRGLNSLILTYERTPDVCNSLEVLAMEVNTWIAHHTSDDVSNNII